MTPTTTEQLAINEARWQEWLDKGVRNDRATARNLKIVMGIFIPLAIIGIVFYLSSVK
jgi:hypothetical protein